MLMERRPAREDEGAADRSGSVEDAAADGEDRLRGDEGAAGENEKKRRGKGAGSEEKNQNRVGSSCFGLCLWPAAVGKKIKSNQRGGVLVEKQQRLFRESKVPTGLGAINQGVLGSLLKTPTKDPGERRLFFGQESAAGLCG
uniref:Uncharacterized protein n=1 Tax=Populus alba TaxID=43335 RepID=A0A4U5MA93_POPAL|nr:hypothetical protein D5086_0000317660 [Populus alba]